MFDKNGVEGLLGSKITVLRNILQDRGSSLEDMFEDVPEDNFDHLYEEVFKIFDWNHSGTIPSSVSISH